MSFVHFLIGLFVLLLWVLRVVYYSYTSPLSGMKFVNTLSHCIACIFILLIWSFVDQIFKFWWGPIYQFIFPLFELCFWCHVYELFTLEPEHFSLHFFFLEVLLISFLFVFLPWCDPLWINFFSKFLFAYECLIVLAPFCCKDCGSSVELILDLHQKSVG